ncbi:MAG: hypothetical protein EBR82_27280 [Caulobacteraceae bacterium]|nr:hypothetical protein [Caulobacteraceae bacterium]
MQILEPKPKKQKKPGEYTKILGYLVRVGTKRHSILLETKAHLEDLLKAEKGQSNWVVCDGTEFGPPIN